MIKVGLEEKQVYNYHPIDNERPYVEKGTIKPGTKVEPVIFEPLRNIELSRSTYKVTTFIDFTPKLEAFKRFEAYLNNFLGEIKDADITMNFRSMTTENCQRFECKAQDQLERIKVDADNLKNYFLEIKDKFLTAIDHIDDDEDPNSSANRQKRYASSDTGKPVRLQYDDLTKEEQLWVEELLVKIKAIDPDLHEVLQRHKRFGFVSWLLGWGVWSNSRNIKAIKRNIGRLHEQNILQDHQIHELAGYLNLTARVVQEHTQALYEIDRRLMRIDNTISQLQQYLEYVAYYGYYMTSIQARLIKIASGLNMLESNVERIYEYLRVLAVHKVNPIILPPESFRWTLNQVKEQMRSNPRLELPHDPQTDIWSYYSIVRVTPVVLKDLLVIVLTIPLLDKSLRMDLYKIHNLPALHPKYNLQAKYELEGEYFALGQHGLYVALPTADDVRLCLTSGGGLCVMNQALYPIDRVEWCVYALFTQNEEKIKNNCLVQTRPRFGDLAYSLGGYMWAISSLVGDKIQIRCIQDTHVQQIKPPLQIVHIGNGCEGYSSSISIPAKSELTNTVEIEERANFFFGFNENYTNIEAYGAWVHLEITELTEEQKEKLAIKLTELPPMTYTHLNKKLQELDYDYPWSVPSKVVLFVLIACAILGVLAFMACLWKANKMKAGYKAMMPISRIIRGKPGGNDIHQLKEVISGILSSDGALVQPTRERTTDVSGSAPPSSGPADDYTEQTNRHDTTAPQPPPRSIPLFRTTNQRSGSLTGALRTNTSEEQASNSGNKEEATTSAESLRTSSSMAGIICDILQDENQTRKFGKFLARKHQPKAE